MNQSHYWGYHLLLDIAGCDPDKINSQDNILQFIQTLIDRIDMTAAGPPQVEFLLPNTANAGWSFTQLITTSSITGHLVSRDLTGYLDIFSCKPFDIGTAQRVVEEFFSPQRIRINFLTRHADELPGSQV